ncbi:MAG TPA: ABC transporter ATP-binding protein [Longimicrobiales bacterium]
MNQYRTLLPFIKPYWPGIVWGMVLVVVASAFTLAGPWLIGRSIDVMREPGVTLGPILDIAGWLLLVALLGGAARYGQRELLNSVSRRIEIDLRDALFAHLLQLDAAFFGQHPTGDLMSRATNDTQAARQAIGPGVMYAVNTLVMTLMALPLMIGLSPRLTLIALVPMVLLPPVMVYFGRAIHRRYEKIQEQFGVVSTLVQENLAGARIVRAYGQEEEQEREFAALNEEYQRRNMRLAKVEGVFRPMLGAIAGGGMVIVVWFGGLEVMRGAMSIGDFVAFGMYLSQMIWPMISLGWVVNLFQRGAASLGRLNAIFLTQPRVREAEQPVRPARVRGEIEFDDVRFTYPGTDREVLAGVSFHVRAGQTVALVGPTGSGKTTIVQLLARAYDPTAGEIRIDGIALKQLDVATLRRSIRMAPQDAFLFSETIAENIALGWTGDGAAAESIVEAIEIAQLTETVRELPKQLETRLGERGINLSGGQRQRAALARAIVGDPSILILDDTLSAVDTRTERAILAGLRRVLADRTAFIISHRVTAVMNADLILVLEEGRIVERGTHAELITRGGLYSTLLRRQLLEEDLESDSVAAGEAAV